MDFEEHANFDELDRREQDQMYFLFISYFLSIRERQRRELEEA